MGVILVTYDLRKPNHNYNPLYEYLEKYDRCHEVESVWLLDTLKSTSKIRDELKDKVHEKDILFVVKLKKAWSSWNYDCADWLKKEGRRWD